MRRINIISLILIILTLSLSILFVGCGSDTYTIIFEQESGEKIELEYEEGTVPSESEIPTPDYKIGHTAVWDITDFTTAENGDEIVVKPVYTAKQFEVTLNAIEGSTENQKFTVTYGQPYDFSAVTPNPKADLFWADAWSYKTKTIAKTGTWELDASTSAISIDPKWQVKVTFIRHGAETVEKLYDIGTTLTMADFPEIVNSYGYKFFWEETALDKVTNMQKSVTVYTTVDTNWSPFV